MKRRRAGAPASSSPRERGEETATSAGRPLPNPLSVCDAISRSRLTLRCLRAPKTGWKWRIDESYAAFSPFFPSLPAAFACAIRASARMIAVVSFRRSGTPGNSRMKTTLMSGRTLAKEACSVT